MEETGYSGLFTVEFLIDRNDDAFFMEVNFRHDGATYLLKPGMNIPLEYCNRILGGKNSPVIISKQKVVGMRERVDFAQSVRTGKVSFPKWLCDFVTADSHMLWNLRDFGPLWFVIKHKFKA